MQTVLVYFHNILRWVILIFLLWSIVRSFSGWRSKTIFRVTDKRVWLFTLIFSHLTLLLGLFQVFFGRFGIFTTALPKGTNIMKDRFYRFFWIEHPVTMLIAIILVTLGYGMAKKSVPDQLKYKKAFWFFLIALLLILAGIPWPFLNVIGRPLIPGM